MADVGMRDLGRTLARLFPTVADVIRMADAIGIARDRIDFRTDVASAWTSLLGEADALGLVGRVASVGLVDHPTNSVLALAAFVARTAQLPCRCGYAGPPEAHPCHARGYTCRKPARQRFYAPRLRALAGWQVKVTAAETWACDECWAEMERLDATSA